MRRGRPKQPLKLSDEERGQLQALASSRSLPHGLARRAPIVLLADEGVSKREIPHRLAFSEPTVGKWRARYLGQGLQGLHDELRPGRPRSISDEEVAVLVRKTLQQSPRNGTHWTVRTLGRRRRMFRGR